jgi:hypothetical protein
MIRSIVPLLLVLNVAPAAAQVSTMAEPVAEPFLIRRPPADLDALTRLYQTSDWLALQRLALEIACVARRNASEAVRDDEAEYETCGGSAAAHPAARALDAARNHVAVMWLGHDAFGKPQLLRVVVHGSPRRDYQPDLPGLAAGDGEGQLVELFLSRSPQGRVSTTYASKREEDPLLAQVPALIQAVAGPLFTTIGTLAGRIPGGRAEALPEPVRPKLTATVKRVGLPFPRATIRLTGIAREPVSSGAFAEAAAALAGSLSFSQVPHAPCARALARTLAAELPAATQDPVCSGPAPRADACLEAFDKVLTGGFTAAAASCESGKPSKESLQALTTVDRAFRGLVEEGTSTGAQLDVTFRNRPPTHFAFGAGSAVMVEAWQTRPRVDAKDGVIVASPLPRVMTMAFVNWSPAGYDPEQALSMSERWRVFAGAALTPDFGAVLGLNVLLVRGIGVTAGGGFLFGKGAGASEIGGPPARPDDPFRLSIARTAFAGISYNFR